MLSWFKKKNTSDKIPDFAEAKYAVGAILDKFFVKSFENMLFVGSVNQSAKWFFEKSGVWVDCTDKVENTERIHFLKTKSFDKLPKYEYVVFSDDFDFLKQKNANEVLQSLLSDGGRAIFISTIRPLPCNLKTVFSAFSFDVETDGDIKVLSCVKKK